MKYEVVIQAQEQWSHLAIELQRAAESALTHETAEEGSLTIVLTDRKTIRDLNRSYAGEDHATDVLSFTDGTVQIENNQLYFGDVIIAVDIAQEQADKAGHTLKAELSLLTVHGVLHLLGYDHASSVDKQVMWSAQDKILHKLGVSLATVQEN